jgi:cytochrome c oxidase subunit 4
MSTPAHARPNYVAVWAWLLFLLIISLAAVYLPFSQQITVSIIFLVAAVKAFLVVVNFMHLKFEQRLVRLIAVVPVIFFIIMTIALIPDIVYNR